MQHLRHALQASQQDLPPQQEEKEEARGKQQRQDERDSEAHMEMEGEGGAAKGAKPQKRREPGAPSWTIRQAPLWLHFSISCSEPPKAPVEPLWVLPWLAALACMQAQDPCKTPKLGLEVLWTIL